MKGSVLTSSVLMVCVTGSVIMYVFIHTYIRMYTMYISCVQKQVSYTVGSLDVFPVYVCEMHKHTGYRKIAIPWYYCACIFVLTTTVFGDDVHCTY